MLIKIPTVFIAMQRGPQLGEVSMSNCGIVSQWASTIKPALVQASTRGRTHMYIHRQTNTLLYKCNYSEGDIKPDFTSLYISHSDEV